MRVYAYARNQPGSASDPSGFDPGSGDTGYGPGSSTTTAAPSGDSSNGRHSDTTATQDAADNYSGQSYTHYFDNDTITIRYDAATNTLVGFRSAPTQVSSSSSFGPPNGPGGMGYSGAPDLPLGHPISPFDFLGGPVEGVGVGIIGILGHLGEEEVGSIAIAELTPTHGITMSRAAYRNLLNDIQANGIQNPLSYVRVNNMKYVVDGNHRLRAAQALGLTSVPAQEVTLPFAGFKTSADLFDYGP